MHKIEIQLEDKREIYHIDYVAKQANGAVLLRQGKAVVLATVTKDDEMVEEDFLPLTVQYIEKSYSAGAIPQGFVKRETKPGDFETLTSRIVDRSLRPLFPKGYAYPTQITILVLSSDPEVDFQVMALNSASVALFLSDIPVNELVCGIRVGKIGEELVANPSSSKLNGESSLDLFVSGTKEQLLMIEMRSISTIDREYLMSDYMLDASVGGMDIIPIQKVNELQNEELVKSLEFALNYIKNATQKYQENFMPLKKEDAILEYKDEKYNEALYIYIDEFYKDDVKDAINAMAKSERGIELKRIVNRILEDDIAKEQEWDSELISKVLDKYKKSIVREQILKKKRRADGRGLEDVRPISIETNILPSVHGSCLFTRGETQALVTTTIGGEQDAQMYNVLAQKTPLHEKFMVHYNFPGFSVGEASPLRAPGRRELGHGNLAKRAIAPTIDKQDNSTIRVVSEILESNGSSSMATVCGGSLSIRAAGVETLKLVAGVAMGLIIEEEEYAILTDIMGLEDHDGDMDFKVAGTRDGITALQMDIKLGGVSMNIIREALIQAEKARNHILDIMEEADKKIVVNRDILPSSEIFTVHPSKIADIIGQAGKTIREIIEKFDVAIDLDRDKGEVKITADNKQKIEEAKEHIKKITSNNSKRNSSGNRYEKNEKRDVPKFDKDRIYEAEVKRITDFGAFVELAQGVDGLIHISKLSDKRVKRVEDVVNIGDRVKVKVLNQKGHKIELLLVEKI